MKKKLGKPRTPRATIAPRSTRSISRAAAGRSKKVTEDRRPAAPGRATLPPGTPGRKRRRPSIASDVLSPSDLAQVRDGKVVTVGGRVVSALDRDVLVADVSAVLAVHLAERAGSHEHDEILPGDLVVVSGRLLRGRLRDAHLVTRAPGKPPTAASEQGRFMLAGVGPRLVLRARALSAVRSFFDRQGFVEVETPLRVQTPGLDAHVDAVTAEDGFLVTSPELHMKRLLVGGFPRVYQLARTSRRDEQGALHEPEFTMLEWYRGFSGVHAVLRDTENLVERVVRELSPESRGRITVQGRRIDVRPPFPRLTVRDLFREHADVADVADLAEADPDQYFRQWVERIEPALGTMDRPVFIEEFPATEAALARKCPHDPRVAERFELYIGGIELCNGFGELTDAVEQRRRFEQERARRSRSGSPVYDVDEAFLSALAEGLPPSGGNALGFDRLVALALGESRIADVMAFPRGKRE